MKKKILFGALCLSMIVQAASVNAQGGGNSGGNPNAGGGNPNAGGGNPNAGGGNPGTGGNPGGSNPNNNPNFSNTGTNNNTTHPNNGVNPQNRTEVPFDAGLSVLLGAGAVAAFKKVRNKGTEKKAIN